MAYDKVVDSAVLNGAMTATANAIREKTGSTEPIPWNETNGFKDSIEEVYEAGKKAEHDALWNEHSVFGSVDENNNIIISGNLADGTYSVKYKMEDGSTVNIGSLVLGTEEPVNQIPISTNEDGTLCVGENGEKGYLLDKRCSVSGGGVRDLAGYSVTGLIPCKQGDVIRIKNMRLGDYIILYNENREIYGRVHPTIIFDIDPYNDGQIATATFSYVGDSTNASTTNCAFVRFNSVEHITDKAIITINEEIA